MSNIDEHFELLCKMTDGIEDEIVECRNERRDLCSRCERPIRVCLCPFFPKEIVKVNKNLKVWIFQHPFEIKRCLRTTRILEKCVDPINFEIIISKRFSIEKFPVLKEVYENEHTYLLYPTETAILIDELPKFIESTADGTEEEEEEEKKKRIHVIILDGTWNQASGIYFTNREIRQLKQVKIDSSDLISAYKIRTQPRECFLSTIETVALTLSRLENKPEIFTDLVRPLEALCDFQFDHGAQPHQSKEFLLVNGLYKKEISKKNLNKLLKDTRCAPLITLKKK